MHAVFPQTSTGCHAGCCPWPSFPGLISSGKFFTGDTYSALPVSVGGTAASVSVGLSARKVTEGIFGHGPSFRSLGAVLHSIGKFEGRVCMHTFGRIANRANARDMKCRVQN